MMKQSYSTFLEQTPHTLILACIPGAPDTFPPGKQLSPECFQTMNDILRQRGQEYASYWVCPENQHWLELEYCQ